jgi:nicotinamidase-related amidase
MDLLPANAALLVIDVQKAIDHPSWGVRNHPDAERRMAGLLAAWRERRMPVYHIRHDSTQPDSTYRPGQPGHDFKPEVAPAAGEPIVSKQTCCAFAGTDLERRLRTAGHHVVVAMGVITNNSVEATVRMAGCLGFTCYLVEDACFTFGRADWHGRERTADEVHAMSLANLHGEYCTVVTYAETLTSLPGAGQGKES